MRSARAINGTPLLTTTRVTNLLPNPSNFTASGWDSTLGSTDPVTTSSYIPFNGDGQGRVAYYYFPLTAGHQYLFLLRAKSPTVLTNTATAEGANSIQYPTMQIRCYSQSSGQFLNHDEYEGSSSAAYDISLHTNYENHYVRFTAPTTGNYMFDLRDSSWNASRPIQVDYEYAGIYDITDLDGKIVDIAHPLNTINIHKGFSVWTDSLGTYPFVSRLREYFGHVNSFAVSNANAGYVAPGANIAGGETSVQILSNFQANPEQFGNSTIIWAGHNNISPTSVVLANVASMVAQLTGEYRVFSLLYNTTWNGTQRGYVDTINAGFASAYGNRYVDVKAALIAAANGQAGDMTDAAAGNVPRSCRVDSIHINRRGIEIVADAFHASCLGGF